MMSAWILMKKVIAFILLLLFLVGCDEQYDRAVIKNVYWEEKGGAPDGTTIVMYLSDSLTVGRHGMLGAIGDTIKVVR